MSWGGAAAECPEDEAEAQRSATEPGDDEDNVCSHSSSSLAVRCAMQALLSNVF